MRILIADDENKVRSALRLLLEQEPGIYVVGEVAQADELPTKVVGTLPDVLLVDFDLPGLQLGDALPTLRSLRPALLVIALSSQPEARPAAIKAGADGFVCKGHPPERLLAAIGNCRRRQPAEPLTDPSSCVSQEQGTHLPTRGGTMLARRTGAEPPTSCQPSGETLRGGPILRQPVVSSLPSRD